MEEEMSKKPSLSYIIAIFIISCIGEFLYFTFGPYYYTLDEINKDNMDEVYRGIIAIICHNYGWLTHILAMMSFCVIIRMVYNHIKKRNTENENQRGDNNI